MIIKLFFKVAFAIKFIILNLIFISDFNKALINYSIVITPSFIKVEQLFIKYQEDVIWNGIAGPQRIKLQNDVSNFEISTVIMIM